MRDIRLLHLVLLAILSAMIICIRLSKDILSFIRASGLLKLSISYPLGVGI